MHTEGSFLEIFIELPEEAKKEMKKKIASNCFILQH